ncbi:MAG: RrF2 family transcriptional regulator [Halorhodospira sp.]
MELTYYTDFALRVLLYAAGHPERRVTMREIAGAYGISQEHLRKVVHRLARHGYLRTVQGRAGGMQLAQPATQIRVGEIIQLMEDSLELIDCDREPCPLSGACSLKRALDEARALFLKHLDQITLAQLLEDPATARQIRNLATQAGPA